MIRKIQQSDFDQMLKLEHEFAVDYNRGEVLKGLQFEYMKYVDMDVQSRKSVEEYLTELPNRITFVDDEEGRIVGFIEGEIEDKPGRVYSKVGFVRNWFVTEQFRNKGIGEKLMAELFSFFKSEDIQIVKLQAFTQNIRSIEVYKHLGFEDLSVEMIKKI